MFGSTLDSSRGNSAASGQLLTPTRFVWPYGGRRVFLSGSFTRWDDWAWTRIVYFIFQLSYLSGFV